MTDQSNEPQHGLPVRRDVGLATTTKVCVELSKPAAAFLRGTVVHMNQRKILSLDNAIALQTSAWLEEIEAAVVAALDRADAQEPTTDQLTDHPSVKRCVCGHLQADHASNGTRFPHPLRYGVCFVCGCREFVKVGQTPESEAA
jgi:hypothetical protein